MQIAQSLYGALKTQAPKQSWLPDLYNTEVCIGNNHINRSGKHVVTGEDTWLKLLNFHYQNTRSVKISRSYLTLIRYWAKLMLAVDPVIVTWRSVEPSTGLAILICAPDIWRISFILAPWRPMMQPISCKRKKKHKYNFLYFNYQHPSYILGQIVFRFQ